MQKSFRTLGLIALLVLTSCSRSSRVMNVRLTDYHFDPENYTVPAGEEITVNVENDGFVSHQILIFKLGTDIGGRFGPEDEENLYWRFEVLPGHTATGTFVAPGEPGEYLLTCGILGHFEAGMLGKLVVVGEE